MNNRSFLCVRDAYQVQQWTHASQQTGLLVYSNQGRSEIISLALAGILQMFDNQTRVADIAARLSAQFSISLDLSLETVCDIAQQFIQEGIVETAPVPGPLRFFPPPLDYSRRLTTLQVQLTNHCNLRCRHCYAESGPHSGAGLPYAQICRLVDEFAALGGMRLFLTGGEPLLREDLEDIIGHAKKRHLFVYLSSNGYAVTPRKAKKLATLGVNAINFSLDGANAQTHDFFRGRKGSFGKVTQAIDAFLALKIPTAVQTTLFNGNLDQSVEIADLLLGKGVANCFFVKMSPRGRGGENQDLVPDLEQFRKSRLAECRNRRFRHGGKLYPKPRPQGNKPESRCSAGISQIYVRHDGSCFPCPSLETDSLLLGRYPADTLKAVWTNESSALGALRAFDHRAMEKCRGCEHQFCCKGGCAGNALRLTGDWRNADPHFCITMDIRKEVQSLPVA